MYPHILVVEDDTSTRGLLHDILELEGGYRTQFASDGIEALASVRHQRPALVIMDLTMPRLDGRELARILRHDDAQLPILLLSAADNLEAAAGALGASAALAKPFELEQLLAAVAHLLQGA